MGDKAELDNETPSSDGEQAAVCEAAAAPNRFTRPRLAKFVLEVPEGRREAS